MQQNIIWHIIIFDYNIYIIYNLNNIHNEYTTHTHKEIEINKNLKTINNWLYKNAIDATKEENKDFFETYFMQFVLNAWDLDEAILNIRNFFWEKYYYEDQEEIKWFNAAKNSFYLEYKRLKEQTSSNTLIEYWKTNFIRKWTEKEELFDIFGKK